MNYRVYILLLLLPFVNSQSLIQKPQNTLTVCPSASACDYSTIQAAVDAAVNGDSIHILTQPEHTEAGIVIDKDLTIFGDGETQTFIQAAISPSAATERVFNVSTGVKFLLRDLTVQHGNPGISADGGCIYNDGGEVELVRTRIWECEAKFGAGVYSTGRLVMSNSSIRLNNAALGGGGIYNNSYLSMENSQVDDNLAGSAGGGIYNDLGGSAFITDSSVSNNIVEEINYEYLYGGGLYNLGTLNITGSDINENALEGGDAVDYGYGGGIYSDGEIEIYNSLLRENSINSMVTSSNGGGLLIFGGTALVSHSTVTSNISSPSATFQGSGGGCMVVGGTVEFSNIVIQDNSAVFGGGLMVSYVSSVAINDSTISSNNASRSGGGLFVSLSQGEGIRLTNVTISGNQVDDHGGGIYVNSTGVVNLANVTITENVADADGDGNGHGGGVIADAINENAGLLYLRNSIIAGNFDLSPGTYAKAPDCDNTVTSQGYNLIGNLGTALNGTHCVIEGDTSGNLIGADPNLRALQDNGGPTFTHALNPGSEAIDAGNPGGCTNFEDIVIPADQRGALRSGRCDIGAYEFGGLLPEQYLPLIFNP